MVHLTLACPIRVALIEAEGLSVTTDRVAYEAMERCAGGYRERYTSQGVTSPGAVEGIQVARRLYRDLGIDPTKTRPSSEALLRRVLKGKELFAVNTLVDTGNWISLDYLLSQGLYDRVRIVGEVTLRPGREGEGYAGINKPPVNVAGRYVLADDDGPFGSPTADSQRTCITEATTEAMMVIFAPGDYALDTLHGQATEAANRIVEICGGEVTRIETFAGAGP